MIVAFVCVYPSIISFLPFGRLLLGPSITVLFCNGFAFPAFYDIKIHHLLLYDIEKVQSNILSELRAQ